MNNELSIFDYLKDTFLAIILLAVYGALLHREVLFLIILTPLAMLFFYVFDSKDIKRVKSESFPLGFWWFFFIGVVDLSVSLLMFIGSSIRKMWFVLHGCV